MSKKAAIITHYYGSCNYGGCLQAYALCKFLNINNIQTEQLSYDFRDYPIKKKNINEKLQHRKNIGLKTNIKLEINKLVFSFKKFTYKVKGNDIVSDKNKINTIRKKVFETFRKEYIPHSIEVYNYKTASKCVNNYDVFITGSDQVWNLNVYNPGFFLDFVPSDKCKISYAASIAANSLGSSEKEIFLKSLKDYKAVSVREENAIHLIKDLSQVTPEFVVDPVLLLDREQWDEIESGRKIDCPYVFCYFLGRYQKTLNIVKKFAKKNNLKIVLLPMPSSELAFMDKNFADEIIIDASPQDFISLIKNAKYVFTDSFHACVFSIIYKKNFVVFNRDSTGKMNSRITSLVNMFGLPERFCNINKKENFSYINNLPAIDYKSAYEKFMPAKEKSKNFLLNNI